MAAYSAQQASNPYANYAAAGASSAQTLEQQARAVVNSIGQQQATSSPGVGLGGLGGYGGAGKIGQTGQGALGWLSGRRWWDGGVVATFCVTTDRQILYYLGTWVVRSFFSSVVSFFLSF